MLFPLRDLCFAKFLVQHFFVKLFCCDAMYPVGEKEKWFSKEQRFLLTDLNRKNAWKAIIYYGFNDALKCEKSTNCMVFFASPFSKFPGLECFEMSTVSVIMECIMYKKYFSFLYRCVLILDYCNSDYYYFWKSMFLCCVYLLFSIIRIY